MAAEIEITLSEILNVLKKLAPLKDNLRNLTSSFPQQRGGLQTEIPIKMRAPLSEAEESLSQICANIGTLNTAYQQLKSSVEKHLENFQNGLPSIH